MHLLKKNQDTIPFTNSFYALGTVNSITVFGDNAEPSLSLAMKRIYEIDDNMSVFKESSEISALNRAAGIAAVKVSDDTFFVIQKALNYAMLTDGCINPMIGPLVSLWRQAAVDKTLPKSDELNRTLILCNYNDINLDYERFTIKLNRLGQSIDLGSIAKGYAADETKKILINYGIKSALIDLGGNIVTIGSRPDGKPFNIGIQHPANPQGSFIGVLPCTDKTVVTSGDYERFFYFNGKRYHHIIDYKTGYPSETGLRSVTVVTKNSIDADALSTAAFVMGLKAGKRLIKSTENADAIFITEDNFIAITDGLKQDFEIYEKSLNIG